MTGQSHTPTPQCAGQVRPLPIGFYLTTNLFKNRNEVAGGICRKSRKEKRIADPSGIGRFSLRGTPSEWEMERLSTRETSPLSGSQLARPEAMETLSGSLFVENNDHCIGAMAFLVSQAQIRSTKVFLRAR
jgi:hypothetical protein